MDRQQRYDQIYEELYQSRPYLRLHNEAMRLLGDVRLEHPEGSSEFREGTLAAYRIEEEAMRIFREMPGTPEEREPEWPHFHRGIAGMALQGGLPDEAAYWAEEGLRSASDTELRDQLFTLIAKSRPEKLLKWLEEKWLLMNWDTGCFKDLPAEEHTPENAVDCLSELIVMLDALEEWAGELYEERGLVVYAMISRMFRARQAAILLESLDSTEEHFEFYHDIVSNDIRWLIDFDNANTVEILGLYIIFSTLSSDAAQKAGMTSQADILMDQIEEIINERSNRINIPGLVLLFFYLIQGSRKSDALTRIEYLIKASHALKKFPQNTEAEQRDYLHFRLLISLLIAYSYSNASDTESAYKIIANQEKEIRAKGYRHLLNKLGPVAWCLYADLSLLAAKIIACQKDYRKQDFFKYLDWVEIYIDKIRKQGNAVDSFGGISSSEVAQELIRLSGEARMLRDMSDDYQTQLGPPPGYLQNLMDSMVWQKIRPAA